MAEYNFVAVDLGATSGRVILATFGGEGVKMEEIHRFPSPIIQMCGHFYWDLPAIYQSVLKGLKMVAERGIDVQSIGIDTWGVDVALFGEDGTMLSLPHSYRDPHTVGAPEEFFKRMPREELYERTGIQVMNFNTLFQLDTMRRNNSSALKAAKKILFIPDALAYLLTGEMVTEYTIASTSHMINPRTRKWDDKILEMLGLDADKFGRQVMPSEKIGTLSEEVQRLTGLGAVEVVAVASHDTGSAVATVPAKDMSMAYLSSGTWSLMGVVSPEPVITERSQQLNFTNEGGVGGTIRVLKNICGMWLLERCRAEWGEIGYGELIAQAEKAEPFRSIINPDAPCFANPESMTAAIDDYCEATNQPVPSCIGEYVRTIFESLALRYRQVVGMLSEFTGVKVEQLYVIGGGAKNDMLNQFSSNAIGVEVTTGASEATAWGNIAVQAESTKQLGGFAEIMQMCSPLLESKHYEPQDKELWQQGYEKFLSVYKEI
ncbi:MAG: rhamnulokinase [Alistipes sp.]|nr:rhamnulokinase [Alistipes sp.]